MVGDGRDDRAVELEINVGYELDGTTLVIKAEYLEGLKQKDGDIVVLEVTFDDTAATVTYHEDGAFDSPVSLKTVRVRKGPPP